MSLYNHVPADDDADAIIDLVQDCREISGLLGAFVPTVRMPLGSFRSTGDLAVAAGVLAGYDDYGS